MGMSSVSEPRCGSADKLTAGPISCFSTKLVSPPPKGGKKGKAREGGCSNAKAGFAAGKHGARAIETRFCRGWVGGRAAAREQVQLRQIDEGKLARRRETCY